MSMTTRIYFAIIITVLPVTYYLLLITYFDLTFIYQGVGGKTSSFSGFGGFSFKPTQTSTPFSANVKSFTNGKPEKPSLSSVTEVNGTPEKKGVEKKKENDSEQATYMSSLRSLNESVLAWIKQHVEKNPYCILTPIFTDYEKHIKTIEAYKSGASQPKSQTTDNSEKKSGQKIYIKIKSC